MRIRTTPTVGSSSHTSVGCCPANIQRWVITREDHNIKVLVANMFSEKLNHVCQDHVCHWNFHFFPYPQECLSQFYFLINTSRCLLLRSSNTARRSTCPIWKPTPWSCSKKSKYPLDTGYKIWRFKFASNANALVAVPISSRYDMHRAATLNGLIPRHVLMTIRLIKVPFNRSTPCFTTLTRSHREAVLLWMKWASMVKSRRNELMIKKTTA